MAIKTLLYIIEGRDNLTPLMGKVGAKMAVLGDTAGKSFGAKMSSALKTVGPMAAAAVAVGFGFAIKAAMDVPLAQLKVTLKNAGTSFDVMKGSIDKAQERMAQLGFTGSETDQAIINLTRATGNAGTSIRMLGTVADLARAKHISLADASLLLAKAADGNTRAIRGFGLSLATGSDKAHALTMGEKMVAAQFGSTSQMADFAAHHHMSLAHVHDLVTQAAHGNINAMNQLGIVVLPKTASSADRLSQIQKVLNERLGGTAAKQAGTFGGQLEVLKAQFTNIAEKIGLAILPYLAKFLSFINKIVAIKPLMFGLVIAITAIALAWGIVAVQEAIAASTLTAATAGLSLVIAAIVVGVIALATHWHQVVDAFKSAWAWLKAHPWATLFLGIIGVIILIIQHWHVFLDFFRTVTAALSHAWSAVCNFMRGLWNGAVTWFTNRFAQFRNFFGSVTAALAGAWSAVCDFFKRLWNITVAALGAAWLATSAWFAAQWHGFVAFWQFIGNSIGNIWNNVMHFLAVVWQATAGWFAARWAEFTGAFQNLGNALGGIWNNVIGGIQHAWQVFTDWLYNIWNATWSTAMRVWNAIGGAIRIPIAWVVDNIWDKFAGIINAALGFFSIGFRLPIITLASGGQIPGYGGGDRHPALLESGETVVSKEHSRKDFMVAAFKAAGVPGYATGGNVGMRSGNPGRGQVNAANDHTPPGVLRGAELAAENRRFGINSPLDFIKKFAMGAMAVAVGPFVKGLTSLLEAQPFAKGGPNSYGNMAIRIPEKIFQLAMSWLAGKDAAFNAQSGSASAMLAYMLKQIGHPYSQTAGRFGPKFFDCSGLIWTAAHKAGINIDSNHTLANNEIEWFADHGGKTNMNPGRGDVVGMTGAAPGPSRYGPIGHIGMALGGGKMVSALGTAFGVCISGISELVKAVNISNFAGGRAPAGTANAANGHNLFAYLLHNLFGGNKIATAGALASIWGESGWNPESVGSGGNGLIGWTPARPGIVTGNVLADFNKQLPMIIQFVQQSGDMGAIAAMKGAKSVFEAANIWGVRVERFGINDVHSAGVAAATAIMQGFDNGGVLRPGLTLAYNGTGRNEYVSKNGGGGPVVVVNGQAFLGSKREVARWVTDALTEYENKGGKVPWSD